MLLKHGLELRGAGPKALPPTISGLAYPLGARYRRVAMATRCEGRHVNDGTSRIEGSVDGKRRPTGVFKDYIPGNSTTADRMVQVSAPNARGVAWEVPWGLRWSVCRRAGGAPLFFRAKESNFFNSLPA